VSRPHVHDRYVYDFGDGHTMHLRNTEWGSPEWTVQFVVRHGGVEIVSPPLPETQLSILAHAFAQMYFERTGRVAWPTEPGALHLYEKVQQTAEEALMPSMRKNAAATPPAEPAPARRVIGMARTAPPIDTEDPPIDTEDPPPEIALAPVETAEERPPEVPPLARRRVL
jgi:hypothetical protein